MARLRTFLAALFVMLLPLAIVAAEGAQSTAAAEHSGASAEVEHGVTLHPAELGRIGPLPITNSMVVTWLVAAALIIFAQVATRNIKDVPEGAQNFWEWLVESLYDFLEGIIGHHLVKKTFWFFATIFIFILFANWAGLIPGVGTIGWGAAKSDSSLPLALQHVDVPLFRGANADLNMTFGMAIIFFACWIVWALQANGPGGLILHLFGPKGETTGALKVLMVFVFIIVGVLEVVTILFRPITLSFRLYGNIFAGENMLEAMAKMVPSLAWLIPIPFYFLEVLVGLVQALVFMLLTAVFTLLICSHEEGHGQHKAHH